MGIARDKKIKIARRISGGGAVYHDLGNLNFSIISTSDIYNKEENFKKIERALLKIGIKTKISGRNDILLNGKKFSGNAFYNAKNANLHHGTILINSISDTISKCLTPNKLKYSKNSVDSEKSQVCNIKDFYPKVLISDIENALMEAFLNDNRIEIELDEKKIAKHEKKFKSKSWIYKKYQKEGVEISKDFKFGHVDIKMAKNGEKTMVSITSDMLDTQIIDEIERNFYDGNLDKMPQNLDFSQKDVFKKITNLIAKNLF